MEITFTVPGRPIGKGRPRVTRYGTYTPEKTRKYEELIRNCWKEQSGAALAGGVPLVAEIHGYFPIPKGTSKKRSAELIGAPYPHKCDADNLAKSILDALNGLAFLDDSAVCLLCVTKVYSDEPRVDVRIEEMI